MFNNNFLKYTICCLFVLISIVILINAEDRKASVLGFLTLIFFGGLGFINFIIENYKINNHSDDILKIIGSFIIMVGCYYMLPFHHLFDGSSKYTPFIGWVIGIGGNLAMIYNIYVIVKKINVNIKAGK